MKRIPAILMLIGVVCTAARGEDLIAVEGVPLSPTVSGGFTFYRLHNPAQTEQIAMLKDPGSAFTVDTGLPGRFLCSDTGTVSNGLPVLLVRRAMPSSASIPACVKFFQQGPDTASGEGRTVVASDTHADPDMDGDGVPSYYESAGGSDPTKANANTDADGDGHSLLWEYIAGTNPSDPASVLKVTSTQPPTSGPFVVIAWASVAGKRYELQRATSAGGTYSTAGSATATGPASSLQLPASTSPDFFRVLVKP